MQVEAISTATGVSTHLQGQLRDQVLSIITQYHCKISSSPDEVNRRIEERIDSVEDLIRDQEARLYASQESRLGPYYGVAAQHRGRRSRAERKYPDGLHPRPDAVGVRLARYNMTCRTGCPCSCHKQRKLASAAVLDRAVGQLFVGYVGVPGLNPKCDDASCQTSQTAHVNMKYWFPLGFFWSQIVRLQMG